MAKTLLLADDSVTIQKVVGISFANEDVTLLTVDNGDDAVSRTRETRPDIVLADVVMPGLNGYEVCEAIKSDPELRDTPVLLLTGTFEAFDEERATRVGADGYITKPFEAQALVDQVNARLSQAAAAAPAPEPAPASAPLTASEQAPSPEDSLGLPAVPDMSPAGGDSFDFFDEETTEPRTAPEPASSAETVLVSDDLGVAGEAEDAFAFAAPEELDDELSTSDPSVAEAEIDAPAEMMEEWAEPEMASDSTVAIPADSDAFASAPTEPPSRPPTLGDDDLAVGAVLDPAGGRDFDVSSSDLGDPLKGTETTLEAAEEEPSSPWSVEAPALAEGEVLPEPDPGPTPDPLLAPQEDASASSTTSAPDLSPLALEQLHDALEKVAWEAFSEVTEQIVKEALERIERVAWEVIPQMAEALIREEMRKLKGEDD